MAQSFHGVELSPTRHHEENRPAGTRHSRHAPDRLRLDAGGTLHEHGSRRKLFRGDIQSASRAFASEGAKGKSRIAAGEYAKFTAGDEASRCPSANRKDPHHSYQRINFKGERGRIKPACDRSRESGDGRDHLTSRTTIL